MKIEKIIAVQQDITNVLNNPCIPVSTTSRGAYVISKINKLKKQLRLTKLKNRIANIILIALFILFLLAIITSVPYFYS